MEKNIVLTDIMGTCIDSTAYWEHATDYYKREGREYGVQTFGTAEMDKMEWAQKKDPYNPRYVGMGLQIHKKGIEENKIIPQVINGADDFYEKCIKNGFVIKSYSHGSKDFVETLLKKAITKQGTLADVISDMYASFFDYETENERLAFKTDPKSYRYIISKEGNRVAVFISDRLEEVIAAAKAGIKSYYFNLKHKKGKSKASKDSIEYTVISDYKQINPEEFEENEESAAHSEDDDEAAESEVDDSGGEESSE